MIDGPIASFTQGEGKHMKRFTAFAVVVAAFSVQSPRAQDVTERSLAYHWDPSSNPSTLATPIGKVIVAQQTGQHTGKDELFVTFVLHGATQQTNYTLGFDIFVWDENGEASSSCGTMAPETFGKRFDGTDLQRDVCPTRITLGGRTVTAGVYPLGTLTTDGDGSLHVALKNLPSGSYTTSFWSIPCWPPLLSCGYFPDAGTAPNGEGEVFTFP